MHKLARSLPEPSVLADARNNRLSDWVSFSCKEKKIVRDSLLDMQRLRCAYCECSLKNGNGHIEHFRKRSLYRELTFVWTNLFYSCMNKKTCGKLKDSTISGKKENELLIDICKDNPEDFFVFDMNGRIAVRSKLSESDKNRAAFTIKAFGLNESNLVQNRKENLTKYYWFERCPDEINAYPGGINAYLDEIAAEPFITSIYHYFGKRMTP